MESAIAWHIEAGGGLFYPDTNEPYAPDDLPKRDDDEAGCAL
jgi:hypothetical protein